MQVCSRKGFWCQVQYSSKVSIVVDILSCIVLHMLQLYRGKSIVLKCMEVSGEVTSVAQLLISKFADKKVKIPPVCLEVLKDGISAFGIKHFPVKEVIAALPSLFNGSNSQSRDMAMQLMLEIHRWIGRAPLETLLEAIRTAQKTEFEKLIEAAESRGKAVPSLYLVKERPDAAALAAAAQSEDTASSAGTASSSAADDAREYVQDIDLAKKLKATEYSTLIAEEKWSEQLKGLQLILTAVGSTPKLKAGSDLHEYVDTCKGFLRPAANSHVNVQAASLRVLQALADGARNEFSGPARTMLSYVISKCKEKRMIADVTACITTFLTHCLNNFDPFMDDVSEILKNKKSPPHATICMMEFIVTVIRSK